MNITIPDNVLYSMHRGAELRLQTDIQIPPHHSRARASLHYPGGPELSAEAVWLRDALEALAPAAAAAELKAYRTARRRAGTRKG